MIKVPSFGPIPGLEAFLNALVRYINESDRERLLAQSANEHILLYAPNKDVYKVHIDDTGTLKVDKV